MVFKILGNKEDNSVAIVKVQKLVGDNNLNVSTCKPWWPKDFLLGLGVVRDSVQRADSCGRLYIHLLI